MKTGDDSMIDDEPQLTPEEEAELVARINANPNLHPMTEGQIVVRLNARIYKQREELRHKEFVLKTQSRRIALLEAALKDVRTRLDWGGHTGEQIGCPTCDLYNRIDAVLTPYKGGQQ